MGERGQVCIKMHPHDVYLYTHWEGDRLEDIVKTALAKGWRWDDEEYLARIIFEEMTIGQTGTETGFGIGTAIHGDLNYPLITVDVPNKKVMRGRDIIGVSFAEFITGVRK